MVSKFELGLAVADFLFLLFCCYLAYKLFMRKEDTMEEENDDDE